MSRLDDIPTNEKKLPSGVTEVTYKTQAEMTAFLDGLHFADDIDVENGQPFERNGEFVVRVSVGEFDDDFDLDDDLEDDDEL